MARRAHLGQCYGGADYFKSHVTDVARRVAADPRADAEVMAVAWLHDTIEDTQLSIAELAADGLTIRQQLALMALTRWDHEHYADYIKRVMLNRDAMLVKLHDLESNIAAEPPVGTLCKYLGARIRIQRKLARAMM